jgi:hypothetical protein
LPVWKHEAVIQELTKFNQHLHETLVNVNKRLEKLEAERGVYHPSASSNELNRVQMYRGAADKRSRSPSLAGAPGQRSGKKSKVRKDLKIKIYNGPKGVGLPTPIITVSLTPFIPRVAGGYVLCLSPANTANSRRRVPLLAPSVPSQDRRIRRSRQAVMGLRQDLERRARQ